MEKYLGDSALLVKRRNRTLILELILKQGPISRVEISGITGLSRAAVSTLTGELLDYGIISEFPRESSEEKRGAGRIPILLDIRSELGGVIAIDIARKGVNGAFVNLKGGIEQETSRKIVDAADPSHVAGLVRNCIDELSGSARARRRKVLGIGVSLPGIIDRSTGFLEYSSTLGWKKINLIEAFGGDADFPLIVDRNVRAMVLAEHFFGVGQGFSNLALVYVGIGIGCGIIINGEVYSGSNNRAGEIGHTHIVDDGGRKCFCGSHGCLETVASGQAIAEIAIEEITKGTRTQILELVRGDLTQVTAEIVSKAAEMGDELARRILGEAGRYLGLAVANLVNSFDPRLVILAGGVMNAGSLLIEPITRIVRERILGGSPAPEIRVSQFGGKIGIIGAAALALKELVYSPRLVLPGDVGRETGWPTSIFTGDILR